MPPEANPSPARVLAPTALVVVAIAFLFVLATSGTGDDDSPAPSQRTERTADTTAKSDRKPAARKSTYTVKTGDTLGAIAEKTGLEVERLQELNPDLDPQALVSGQKIKLRE